MLYDQVYGHHSDCGVVITMFPLSLTLALSCGKLPRKKYTHTWLLPCGAGRLLATECTSNTVSEACNQITAFGLVCM